MSELKPCPFCGNTEPEFERVGTPRQSCIVACGNCGARHESSDEGKDSGASWNRRAQPAQAGQVLTDEDVAHIWQHFGKSGASSIDSVELTRAIEQAVMAKRVPQWLPIETAPKDGKRILVHFGIKGVREVFWGSPFDDEVTEENGLWCVDDDKHGPYGLRGYIDNGPTAPTHWMPLPPPPGIVGEKGGA